jgi:hypothetical protein
MAWFRGKGGKPSGEAQPPSGPASPEDQQPEMLPVITDEGTTKEREASKRLRTAEADLKRLKRREARAKKMEEKRRRDRRRIERSEEMGPTAFILAIAVLNGIAAALIVVYVWFPDWWVPDVVQFMDSPHWEYVAICFLASGLIAVWLLWMHRRSTAYLQRTQMALGVYVATGIIGTFCGLLLGFILVDMETLDVDWMFWVWVFLYTAGGSGLAMLVVHMVAHRSGSRAFLTPSYHKVQGVLSAVFAVSVILLPFLYLPYMGWMYEVGWTVYLVSLVVMVFPLPAVAVSIAVKGYSQELERYYSYA